MIIEWSLSDQQIGEWKDRFSKLRKLLLPGRVKCYRCVMDLVLLLILMLVAIKYQRHCTQDKTIIVQALRVVAKVCECWLFPLHIDVLHAYSVVVCGFETKIPVNVSSWGTRSIFSKTHRQHSMNHMFTITSVVCIDQDNSW